ncbi:MAG: lipopolysaccharide heptosyltransferase II [Planctomycetes bacterium]|nr:lipopolysaccharide heptosyltransferase II [Planctomycetota bacterium]
MNIAILLPNWIGDVVMATPALRSLRTHFPADRILGVMRPYVARILDGTSWLDEAWPFDRRAADRGIRFWPVARRLRRETIGLAIVMPNSLSAGLLAAVAGAKERVGFGGILHRGLLTQRLSRPRQHGMPTPYSAVDHYLALAQAVGCPAANRRLELALTEQDQRGADGVWQKLQWGPSEFVVAVNTGSANSPARNWPTDRFAEVIRTLVARPRIRVLVLGGPREKADAEQLVTQANHPAVRSLADIDTSLGVMKGCIARCNAMISTDSGPRHIAAAFGVPTVTIYGSIDRRWNTNYNPREWTLQPHVACGPCGRKSCPFGHYECLRKTTVADVIRAFDELITTTSPEGFAA